jgi:hypothetical protein
MAEAKITTLGLSSIKVGNIASDGGMGQTLAALGLTYENTCNMVTEDPTVTEFFSEENDDPVASLSKSGKTTLNFSIMDANVDTLVAVFGGEKKTEGTAPQAVTHRWEAPSNVPVIEKSIEVKPITGLRIEIPRASIRGKMNSQFSKNGLFLIDVVCTVLVPTKANTPKMTIYEPTIPGTGT